jgi:outer membrane protein
MPDQESRRVKEKNMSIKKYAQSLLAAGLLACAAMPALAEGVDFAAGTWLVRGRVIGVLPDPTSTISTIGGSVKIADYFVPEVDFTYFLTDQIAVELIAATSKHAVKAVGTAAGTVNLGSSWILPPTLTVQWHPMPKASFSPYVGAGVNYTFFYNAKVPGGLIQNVSYKNGASAAVQAGIDIAIAPRWSLNLDYKRLFLSTTANVNRGFVIAKVDIDPSILGVGFGYKF